MNTADAKSVNDSESNETVFTPAGGPGVLDDPVFLAIFRAPADSEDSVIESCSAGSAVENTTGIGLENGGIGFNGD